MSSARGARLVCNAERPPSREFGLSETENRLFARICILLGEKHSAISFDIAPIAA
jgi:hypothetical protein